MMFKTPRKGGMNLVKSCEKGTFLPTFSRSIGSEEVGYGNQLGLQNKKTSLDGRSSDLRQDAEMEATEG